MSGNIILTDIGRDELAKYIIGNADGKIHQFRLGEGGFAKSSLVTETIEDSATGSEKEYNDYIISGGDFDITDVNTGTKTFKVDDDKTEFFTVGAQIKVAESTGNDGAYTVASSSYGSGETSIVVNETISSAVVDGKIYVDRLPILKGPIIGAFHHPMRVVEYNGVTPVQVVEDTTGTGSLTGDGTGTVNYKYGNLNVTFNSNVAPGNKVVVEYKYANVPLSPSTAKTQLDSQGDSTLYTFAKEFTASDFTFRGVGFGTQRVRVYVSVDEALTDGDSYGGTPYFFEGGIFDEDNVLLCYFTFDKERKRGNATITHNIDFIF